MNIQKDLSKIEKKTVIALGLFDGMHRGHQEVLGTAKKIADQKGLDFSVLTFTMLNDSPEKKRGQKQILSNSIKMKFYENIGIVNVIMPDFDDIKEYEYKEFVQDILISRLNASEIVCGYDFCFGKNAKGNAQTLTQIANENNVNVTTVPARLDDNEPISSTRIRALLAQGNIQKANSLLGFPYYFDFEPEQGEKIGTMIESPTINQQFPSGFAVPKFGVYRSYTDIGGKRFLSITNIGVKPTIPGERNPLAETHIIGVDSVPNDGKIIVSLSDFLRPEQKFESIEELKKQIKKDIENAKSIAK